MGFTDEQKKRILAAAGKIDAVETEMKNRIASAGPAIPAVQTGTNIQSTQIAPRLDISSPSYSRPVIHGLDQLPSLRNATKEIPNPNAALGIGGGIPNYLSVDPQKWSMQNIDPRLEITLMDRATENGADPWRAQQSNAIFSAGGNALMFEIMDLVELKAAADVEQKANMGSEILQAPSENWNRYQQQVRDLKAQYGDEVTDWIAYIEQVANQVSNNKFAEDMRQAGKDAPFWTALPRVAANKLGGLGALDVAVQKVQRAVTGSDVPIDYNRTAQLPSVMATSIQQGGSERIAEGWSGEVGSFLYNTALSMADSLTARGSGKWGAALLGGSAATSAMQDARQRGATDEQALTIGIVAGAMEAVMEKLSIDSLFGLKAVKNPSAIILNALKQMGAEGAEEGLTTLANTIADILIMGDKNEILTRQREIMAANPNMSEADALKEAQKEWGINLGLDALGGAVSGFVFGGFQSGADYRRYKAVESVMPKIQQTQQEQATPIKLSNGEYTAVENVLANSRINNTNANLIINSPELAQAFTDITGVELVGTTEQKRQLIREAARVRQNSFAESETLAQEAAEQAYAEYEQAKTEQEVRDSGYRSYVIGMFANGGATVQEAQEILRNPELKAEWEAVTGKKLPDNPKSAIKMIRETKRDPYRLSQQSNPLPTSTKAVPDVQTVLDAVRTEQAQTQQARAEAVAQAVQPDTGFQKRTEVADIAPDVRGGEQGARPATETVGDMGAKTSDFPHEVRESQTGSNTIAQSEEEANVPEGQRRTLYYDAMSEEESLHNARERLDLDYEGEMDALARSAVWSNEEVDMGMAILRDLQAEAAETGDWSAYRRWRETVKQHGVASGQGLQAWAKYTRRTGDRLLEDSSDILEDYDGDDADELMDEINDLSDEFDDADENLNVDDLLAIIRRTSATRRTGSFFRNRFSRQMEWALERVAGYARDEVAGGNAGENFEYLLDFAYNGIRNIAEDHIRPAASDAYLTIRRNAMLSKASTTMRNLVGNNVFDPLDSVAGDIAVPLDALLSTITGTRSVAFDRSWASAAKRQGALDGLARAMLETGLDVHVAQEAGRYENTANRTFKMSGGVFSRLMSSWEKWMGYALNVTDEFQKGGIEAETQRGIDRLYERGRIAADDDSLRNAGEQEALYRTFQDDTAIYRAVQGIREGLNRFHVGNLGVGDLAIPFARVPANLPARAMDYSPIGLVRGIGRLGRVLYDAHNGNLTAAQQAQAVKDIGRGITGSGLIAAATALALKGVIHVVGPGGEEESKDKAASDKAKGLSGTQLNVSAMIRATEGGSTEWRDGDTLMSIGFLDPINAQLTTGALIAEDIQRGEADFGTMVQDSFTGTLQSLLDLPVMQTFQEVANAYQYSNGETSGEKIVDAGKQWLASEAVSIIPNSLKGIAQGMDEYQRDVYAKDDLLGQTIDQMIGSIPGMRDRLKAKQDVYGNDVKNPEQPLNFLNSNILPGAITPYTETDLMRVLDDLAQQTGSNAAYLSKSAPKTVTVGDKTVALSKDQQRQFMTERGKVYEAASAAIQDSGKFQKLSKEMQLKVYEYAEKFATQAAKAALGIGYEIDTKWMREIASKSADWQAKAIIDRAIENAKK